jgi:hypothetical protein
LRDEIEKKKIKKMIKNNKNNKKNEDEIGYKNQMK